MRETPNFTGWHAAILHREDSNTERLIRQLTLLGLSTSLRWEPLSAMECPDLVIVDADQGWDGLLASAPAAHPAVPVIALLGSEAPGRIAWALEQGAGAIIAKPVASSAVYPALVMAVSIHQERMATRSKMDRLEERVRMRPLVHAAVQKIMEARGVGEEQAYTILRGSAMQRRLPMEQLAAFILGGSEPLPEAV
ncbi:MULTISPECIES: ANTAR domain-containing response regulator [unclassified Rhizobium]|uniref:ANTAR domain-containing response regulator n=1 Tax=unclassified Rhizobium TaxID=2613769 RepID=UPI001ADA4360|nr:MULTISPECIES: ANTAR domain-containing protein [unclassified Rhizobium]MBO9100550.1 ANTAR domain-containing protein [Rhizobium sp. L58/93]MBO9136088.1 ANTAR domain-containing protein [Rhizobium sp. B209b/85]MBO9171399.1 ANTAR domain-containing protein [Rhizobium sp. L245/93]MBO9187266.1 ANTAR domain-containing protein [Rhizobium sp. E27B/91]QXZ87946.1 ANTAR domain-containing protein [Rhizobium sp. K1/93]